MGAVEAGPANRVVVGPVNVPGADHYGIRPVGLGGFDEPLVDSGAVEVRPADGAGGIVSPVDVAAGGRDADRQSSAGDEPLVDIGAVEPGPADGVTAGPAPPAGIGPVKVPGGDRQHGCACRAGDEPLIDTGAVEAGAADPVAICPEEVAAGRCR